ncbi:aldo/keto reductase [Piscinibacter sp. XHJ-5]|uniref:aldo/keto reductase n=1 Tax=Piscinibacter sp. XHJ-5 TaxID=3037797 RepID=UPI002452C49C|nr:aldo/keto reductase [Piscinibacter sp. XHJ-5]
MNLVELGRGGPPVSPIAAGAWRLAAWGFNVQERLRWIEQCMELGVTTFDHADIYGGYTAEGLFGEALALRPLLRRHMQLVGKAGIRAIAPRRPDHRVHHYDSSAAHLTASVERSLQELRTDHLDLLLIHRPDCLMDADEVAAAFERLRAAGKVRHFGVSNFTASQFDLLNDRFALVTNQIELHPLRRDPLHDGTLDQLQRLRLRPMIWSPVAGGALFTGVDDATRRVQGALNAVARRHGVEPATIAYAWLLRLPSKPVPIVGSRRIAALREAVAALKVTLDAPDWTEIWEAAAGHEVP